jgi:hypothetical protein
MHLRNAVSAVTGLTMFLACGGGGNGLGCPMDVPLHCSCGGDPTCINGEWTCPSDSSCNMGGGDSGGLADAGRRTTLPDGAICVDIDPSMFSDSCHIDTDCMLTVTGQVCSGECTCGASTPVSASAEAAYEALLSGVANQACPCHALATPRCVSGQCTTCGGPKEPACTQDARGAD